MEPMIANKKMIRDVIHRVARKQDFNGEVFCGLVGNELKKYAEEKRDFIYLDHSYFKRGWNNQHFRACRNWVHQTKTFNRPDDRLKKFDVQIKPWRKTGTKICIIPNTVYQQQAVGGVGWPNTTLVKLKQIFCFKWFHRSIIFHKINAIKNNTATTITGIQIGERTQIHGQVM